MLKNASATMMTNWPPADSSACVV